MRKKPESVKIQSRKAAERDWADNGPWPECEDGTRSMNSGRLNAIDSPENGVDRRAWRKRIAEFRESANEVALLRSQIRLGEEAKRTLSALAGKGQDPRA